MHYLSPHFDDAALSCGGLIHRQTQQSGSVTVSTICAGSPTDPLSPYAEQMHRNWSVSSDIVALRRAEDEAALDILGATTAYLSIPDCIYRGYPAWYYTSDAAIFGPLDPADLPLSAEIGAQISAVVAAETVIYAPLGVGNHVDHQLTHEAAWRLHQQGYTVLFYEDYPYVDPAYPFSTLAYRPDDDHRLQARLAQIAQNQGRLTPQLEPLSLADVQAKAASVRAYASQMEVLFGGLDQVESRLLDFARRVGAGQLAERVWRPSR